MPGARKLGRRVLISRDELLEFLGASGQLGNHHRRPVCGVCGWDRELPGPCRTCFSHSEPILAWPGDQWYLMDAYDEVRQAKVRHEKAMRAFAEHKTQELTPKG